MKDSMTSEQSEDDTQKDESRKENSDVDKSNNGATESAVDQKTDTSDPCLSSDGRFVILKGQENNSDQSGASPQSHDSDLPKSDEGKHDEESEA